METLLTTIDRLGVVKIKHLQQIHNLNYRNTCHIVSKHLRPFINETYYQKEKVIYLNKKGKEFICSTKEDIKIGNSTYHSLLRNEVYIYLNCPIDWKTEHVYEKEIQPPNRYGISFGNMSISSKKKIVCDAVYKRNGYVYLIEIDNERKMIDNKKKIEAYREIMPWITDGAPILCFYTKTETRRKKLKEWLGDIRHEVKTFEEIK